MERKIVVYGHGDKRPGLGFPTDRDFEQWIKEDIFTKNRGRYHYTIGKDADVIVLSRHGLASGHFEIEDKEGEYGVNSFIVTKVTFLLPTKHKFPGSPYQSPPRRRGHYTFQVTVAQKVTV